MRAGATPQTFDGAQTVRFNDKAKKLVALISSESLSARTTDEGSGKMVRLQSSNWNGSRYFGMGQCFSSGPATNSASKGCKLDVVALDIDIKGNTTMQIDITEVLGATQTGTHDVEIEVMYADGELPNDVRAALEGLAGCPSAKGGTYNYLAAKTTAGETAMTGNAGALVNIPPEANEIVGIGTAMEADGAVTADEEHCGHVRVDYGLTDQGDQEYALPGLQPNDGTEVEGNEPRNWSRRPVFIGDLPSRELQVNCFASLYGAVTGGVGVAINFLWR